MRKTKEDLIQVTKDSIKSVEKTVSGANGEIAKALKGMFRKDDIKKSHTILQKSLTRKQILESAQSEREAKRNKLG